MNIETIDMIDMIKSKIQENNGEVRVSEVKKALPNFKRCTVAWIAEWLGDKGFEVCKKGRTYVVKDQKPEPASAPVPKPEPEPVKDGDGFTENQRLVYDTVLRLNKEGAESDYQDLVDATGLTFQEVLSATCKLNALYWMHNDWVERKGFTGWIARTPDERDRYVPTEARFRYVLDKLAKNPDGLTDVELGAKKNTIIWCAVNQLTQGQKIFCECTTGKFKLSERTRLEIESRRKAG